MEKTDKPFQDIKDVEGDEKKFFHLGGMYAFMVYGYGSARSFGKKDSEEIYGIILFPEWQDSIANYFHRYD